MAKKPSELDVEDAKNYLRVDHNLDNFLIDIMLESAKGYVQSYTKRKMEELEQYPEVSMAILVLVSHFYDNRTLEANSSEINFTLEKLLGLHWYYVGDQTMEELEDANNANN